MNLEQTIAWLALEGWQPFTAGAVTGIMRPASGVQESYYVVKTNISMAWFDYIGPQVEPIPLTWDDIHSITPLLIAKIDAEKSSTR